MLTHQSGPGNGRPSLSSRARDVRRTRQRREGSENNGNNGANPGMFGRQRPPSPSTLKSGNTNNNTNLTSSSSPPSSPQFEDNHGSSPSRRSRNPVIRPPLKQQHLPLAMGGSLSWDEPPDHTMNHSSNALGRLNSSSDRSVSSEWGPSPQSNRQHSPTHQPYADSSNLSVASDSCLVADGTGASRSMRKRNHASRNNQPPYRRSVNQINGEPPMGGEDGEDIPMDERSADIRSFHGPSGYSSNTRTGGPALPPSVNVSRSHGPGGNHMTLNQTTSTAIVPATSADDDVSSLGGVEETNIGAMIAGLRAKTPTLHRLTPEEKQLWDTIQTLLNERQDEVTQLQEKLLEQQEEQDGAMRAIQRVLADVTHERDKAMASLDAAIDDTEEKKEAEHVGRGRDYEIRSLRQELAEVQERYSELKAVKDASESELDSQRKQVAKLKRHLHMQRKGDPSEDPEKLKRQLDEKSSQLENAKMIITSLENASGDMASDTRVKLKAKDMEIASLKMDLHQCKKTRDTLATELREVQRVSAESDDYKHQLYQDRSELSGIIEASLADLRSASVILETTHDPSSVQNLVELFADCGEALKRSLDHFNEANGDDDDGKSAQQRQMVVYQRDQAPSEAETKSMQEEIRKLKEESLHYRLEAERVEKHRENEVKNMSAEIEMLRLECSTNMEVLTKKERELVVLRDSLKEEEVGYISDDAEDDDEDEETGATPPPPPSTTSSYTTSQVEALATILAHAGKQQPASPPNEHPVSDEKLKGELTQARLEKERALKELKTEKESLANAKMIISSLEKANKSMMEDLRSRLHDSNSAIASLLEKSMESEKTTAKLQAELEMEKARNERARTNNITTETID